MKFYPLFKEIEKTKTMGRIVTVMPDNIHAMDTDGNIHEIIGLFIINPTGLDRIYKPYNDFFKQCVFDGIKHEIHEITPEGIIIK